jgi:pentapeptide MXKDX repeat protein
LSRLILGACVTVAMLGVALGAQDKMADTGKMDSMAKEQTFTGCVESAQAGRYSLTHVKSADAMKQNTKKHDAMSTKSGNNDGMAKDAMKTDSMKGDAMMKDSMAPESLGLSSSAVDLSRHVGHKVSVTGAAGDTMGGMVTFTVKSLKMVAKSCS